MRPVAPSMTALVLGLGLAASAQAQVISHPGLTLDGAKAVAGAAAAEAHRLNAGGAIAIVDEGGAVLYVERLANTFVASTTVAIEKARTAAQFRRPTRDFENAIAKGRTSLVAVSAMTPLQGGVPIQVDGQIVGAIGVSGAMSAQQDDDIATLAAGALQAPPSTSTGAPTAATAATPPPTPDVDGVILIDGATTRDAFVKGRPLIETGAYKVHASRRDAPGIAELHARDTDILYVLDGTATLVTGGRAVDGKTTAPDEIRGARIEGGTTRALAKGDVVIIPSGVPHWFRDVQAPFLYYTVKVTGPASTAGTGR
jgi:glc operon protein GlcG